MEGNCHIVLKSAWEWSASHCTAKKFKIMKATLGLLALVASAVSMMYILLEQKNLSSYQIWSTLVPPEHEPQVKLKFHTWQKLITKSLVCEESYLPNVTKHFHVTMGIFNEVLFRNAGSGNVSDQTDTSDGNEPDVGKPATEDNEHLRK